MFAPAQNTLSWIGMGITEVAVRYAVEELQRRKEPITREKVAEIAQCSTRTVTNVFTIWRRRGELIMEGTPRLGYTYHLIKPTDKQDK